MPSITPNELATVAEKLEKVLQHFNIGLKVGLPNLIALHLPTEVSFASEKAMQDFAYQSLITAGVHLQAPLEILFISADQSLTSIILQGAPRHGLN